MKLLAAVSNKYAVFSVGHYDCAQADDGTMMDGGQPGLQDYAGYHRSSHGLRWIELPGVTFAELMNDYLINRQPRKYGIHPLKDIRFLDQNEIPDVDAFWWKAENYLWGTRGKHGNAPFKYIRLQDAETDHLKAIVELTYISSTVRDVVEFILQQRNEN